MSVINLFKSCNFLITLKNQHTIELMIQQASIPGVTINEMPVNWQGLKDKMPGDSIDFNNLSLQVLLDEELNTFKEIYNNLIFSHDPVNNAYSPLKAIFDATLHLTTNKNNIQHEIKFFDCWVSNFSDITLSSDTSEDEQLVVNLDIVYNFFTFK